MSSAICRLCGWASVAWIAVLRDHAGRLAATGSEVLGGAFTGF